MKDFVMGKEIKTAGQVRDGSQWHPKRPCVLVFQGRTSGPGLRTSRTNTRIAPGKLGRVDQPSGSKPLRDAKGFAHPWELSSPSQGPVAAHPHLQGDGKDKVSIQGRPRAPPSGLSPLVSTMQMFEQAQEAEKILYCIVKIQPRIAATLLSSMVPQALGSPAAQPGVDAAPHPRGSAASCAWTS